MIIFDCDGVLVDSELLEYGVDVEMLAPFGCTASAEELLDRFLGIARRDMYPVMFEELGQPMPPDLLERREVRVWDRCRTELRLVPGVAAALDALCDIGKCVASSSRPEKLAMKLEITGIAGHFAPHVFSTALVARGKPAPDIFLHAAAATGHAPADCIVVEDSPHGVAGARAAGMRAIGFIGGGHAGPSLARALLEAGADQVVDSMAALPRVLRKAYRL